MCQKKHLKLTQKNVDEINKQIVIMCVWIV